MPAGKGLHAGPGAWEPQLLHPVGYTSDLVPAVGPMARGGRLIPRGPTNLDLECKAALQRLLKPCHFNVIEPWLTQAELGAKKDVVKMERQLAAFDRESVNARKMYHLSKQEVITNPHGRVRLANAVPVSADRMQADLLKNRCGSDQRDMALQAKRKQFSEFAPIPNTNSVNDYYSLGDMPAGSDVAAKALTEDAKRRLQAWQVRGPERNREAAAMVMRALRLIGRAVSGMPTYHQHSRQGYGGGQGTTDSLHSYTYVVPKHGRTLPSLQAPSRGMQHSMSAPAILRPFIEPEQIANVSRPGGYILDHGDETMLQTLKNRERGIKSKLASNGGHSDWSTTYESHNKAVHG